MIFTSINKASPLRLAILICTFTSSHLLSSIHSALGNHILNLNLYSTISFVPPPPARPPPVSLQIPAYLHTAPTQPPPSSHKTDSTYPRFRLRVTVWWLDCDPPQRRRLFPAPFVCIARRQTDSSPPNDRSTETAIWCAVTRGKKKKLKKLQRTGGLPQRLLSRSSWRRLRLQC